MNNFDFCLIKPVFFDDFPNLKKEANTKETRIYFGITININNNNCFVPFESDLYDKPILQMYSQYALPSSTRPMGGLNFEKCLIINDMKYIDVVEHPRIAHSQYTKLIAEQELIKVKLETYIGKYIRACRKNRENLDYIFNCSTLHEFKVELGIITTITPEK